MPIRDPKAKGVFFGLTLYHTRGHIMKAAMEGIAYGLDQNLDLIRKAGQPLPLITAVGGGTKSPLWMQIMSDRHRRQPSRAAGEYRRGVWRRAAGRPWHRVDSKSPAN